MLYSITNRPIPNGRPTQIGNNEITISNRATHVFTIANFTTETSPLYSDPEGDPLEFVKVLSLPNQGDLYISGIAVVVNQEIQASDITAGNFTYIAENVDPARTATWQFDLADSGSKSVSGTVQKNASGVGFTGNGKMTMKSLVADNDPPLCVGDNTISFDYGVVYEFSSADFTTNTTPPYNDQEGDAPFQLKVLSLPSTGNLQFKGSNVTLNQVMSMDDVDNGDIVYVSNSSITTAQTLTFDFAVSDEGSKIFVSTCLS